MPFLRNMAPITAEELSTPVTFDSIQARMAAWRANAPVAHGPSSPVCGGTHTHTCDETAATAAASAAAAAYHESKNSGPDAADADTDVALTFTSSAQVSVTPARSHTHTHTPSAAEANTDACARMLTIATAQKPDDACTADDGVEQQPCAAELSLIGGSPSHTHTRTHTHTHTCMHAGTPAQEAPHTDAPVLQDEMHDHNPSSDDVLGVDVLLALARSVRFTDRVCAHTHTHTHTHTHAHTPTPGNQCTPQPAPNEPAKSSTTPDPVLQDVAPSADPVVAASPVSHTHTHTCTHTHTSTAPPVVPHDDTHASFVPPADAPEAAAAAVLQPVVTTDVPSQLSSVDFARFSNDLSLSAALVHEHSLRSGDPLPRLSQMEPVCLTLPLAQSSVKRLAHVAESAMPSLRKRPRFQLDLDVPRMAQEHDDATTGGTFVEHSDEEAQDVGGQATPMSESCAPAALAAKLSPAAAAAAGPVTSEAMLLLEPPTLDVPSGVHSIPHAVVAAPPSQLPLSAAEPASVPPRNDAAIAHVAGPPDASVPSVTSTDNQMAGLELAATRADAMRLPNAGKLTRICDITTSSGAVYLIAVVTDYRTPQRFGKNASTTYTVIDDSGASSLSGDTTDSTPGDCVRPRAAEAAQIEVCAFGMPPQPRTAGDVLVVRVAKANMFRAKLQLVVAEKAVAGMLIHHQDGSVTRGSTGMMASTADDSGYAWEAAHVRRLMAWGRSYLQHHAMYTPLPYFRRLDSLALAESTSVAAVGAVHADGVRFPPNGIFVDVCVRVYAVLQPGEYVVTGTDDVAAATNAVLTAGSPHASRSQLLRFLVGDGSGNSGMLHPSSALRHSTNLYRTRMLHSAVERLELVHWPGGIVVELAFGRPQDAATAGRLLSGAWLRVRGAHLIAPLQAQHDPFPVLYSSGAVIGLLPDCADVRSLCPTDAPAQHGVNPIEDAACADVEPRCDAMDLDAHVTARSTVTRAMCCGTPCITRTENDAGDYPLVSVANIARVQQCPQLGTAMWEPSSTSERSISEGASLLPGSVRVRARLRDAVGVAHPFAVSIVLAGKGQLHVVAGLTLRIVDCAARASSSMSPLAARSLCRIGDAVDHAAAACVHIIGCDGVAAMFPNTADALSELQRLVNDLNDAASDVVHAMPISVTPAWWHDVARVDCTCTTPLVVTGATCCVVARVREVAKLLLRINDVVEASLLRMYGEPAGPVGSGRPLHAIQAVCLPMAVSFEMSQDGACIARMVHTTVQDS